MITRELTHDGAQHFDDSVDPILLPPYLAECLRSVSANEVTVEGNRIRFTAGAFRLVSNWNVLVPFGFGELVVDSLNRQVTYRVSVRQIVVFGTIATAFLFVAMLAMHAWQPIFLVPFIWLWMVGGNLMIGIPRFQRFIAHILANAPRTVASV